ncbi:FAD-binding oxidoreductase [Bartonella krasnovii]|uniref:FAD-binding oxidoreductase n=1 Tax=Bartonella krasnovii TaxID=2267275 RepID=A0A5B9D0Z9_9HYPH|nr:FAD-binding oxidoreductase [Bartonella krasnovii]QEE11674.1 FAD-binding oxidoreductase [Bartonella krasnovii]UNF29436.1 FAD-binding oxidoreductase [Bartonella krasnovii]UNF35794.1 FAD-binding oxidoreductase [Bartonella krasnovii]UNF37414.1 FAD-binding oxidoreductase [Bartonella krasnovii]UNF39203.1 FAD-binding oxidoreductase [Bartonella krasnovii]
MEQELIERFREIVGAKYAITDQTLITPYLLEERGIFHGRTPLLLRPSSPQEISLIMQLASQTRTPIVPQGGNTGLVGGQQPDERGESVLLSMERLNKIRAINLEGSFVVVEAGVILQDLQKKVDESGRFFPLSLASEGSCQIGGNLSSNAGGTAVLAYGNMRDLCLGLEVVLPDGRLLDDLRFVKKDNSGYDLKNLFIGAEGTLGIITAAVLKIFPKMKAKAIALVGLHSPENALEFLSLAQEYGGGMVTGFELMGNLSFQMALDYKMCEKSPFEQKHEWYVLMNISSLQGNDEAFSVLSIILEKALKRAVIEDAIVAQSLKQQHFFWQLREAISSAQKLAGGSIKHDIAVPLASIPDFIAKAALIVEDVAPGARVVCFGHMGDGNLHYNVTQPIGADTTAFLQLWSKMNHRIHRLVMDYQGAFSAEHGIGQLKREELRSFKSPVALDIMRGIKKTLDPLGIMNPGKVL